MRARRGLETFLKRKAAPPAEHVETLVLPDGCEKVMRIRRHASARRLTLRLAPDASEVRVTIPRWAPFSEGRAFALSRRDWLAAQLARIPQPMGIGIGSVIGYRGRDLTIAWDQRLPRRPALVADRLQMGGPEDGVAGRVRRWLESEALALASADLAFYCAAAGIEMPTVRLSRAQRRWGSCSSKGALRINWRLAMAPDMVRRSVVAHEVAHLVHFDHSPQFHTFLGQIFEGDIAVADAWLKRHGRTLHAPFG